MISPAKAFDEFAVSVLKTHIEREKIAASYLFTGEDIPLKEKLAMAFACALNCTEKNSFAGCSCGACRKIQTGSHPDVRIIGDHENRSIKIEEIRDTISWVYLRPYEGKYKVFILKDADRMTLESSNAILKTLEEPPANSVFLLLAESKSHMIETIQSRCFHIRTSSSLVDVADQEAPMKELGNLDRINWNDILELQGTKKREEVSQFLLKLLYHFRFQLKSTAGSADRRYALADYLKAFDKVYDTREAVEANTNIKLSMSRLTMQLEKIFSTEGIER